MPRLALTVLALAILAPAPALAQARPSSPLPMLGSGQLQRMVRGAQSTVEQCAQRTDTPAYVTEVRANVRPGRSPATLYYAAIRVTVRSRPRHAPFEVCVRRRVEESIRQERYAVRRTVSSRASFQIAERPETPRRRPPPAYSEATAQRTLRAASSRLRRCVEIAGVPEQVTLQVAVEADGRMTLMNAQIPGGATRHALPCLARAVSTLRVSARPPRRMRLTHSLRL